MTATITDNDTDFFTIVNSEESVACESNLECGNAAVWSMKALCCGSTVVICEDCRVIIEYTLDQYMQENGYECLGCGTDNFDYVYNPI